MACWPIGTTTIKAAVRGVGKNFHQYFIPTGFILELMKKITLIILFLLFMKSVFAQQIYFEDEFGLNSTEIDTSLHWYGIYPNPNANPRVLGQQLIIKPVHVILVKDSFSIKISTDNVAESEYLIGFKTPVNIDSFPEFHFQTDENYHNHFITAGSQYYYNMGEMGMLKMYANGTIKRTGDSVSINNYDLIVEHQCYATPYMTIRGWQYDLSFDVYAPCRKESLNHFFNIRKNNLMVHHLPMYIGSIDLNQDNLLDLIFLYRGEYYLLFSTREKKSKNYVSEVKRMKFDWGIF